MIVQKSVRYGLILGAIGLGVSVLLYAANPSMIIQGIFGIVTGIIILALWIVFATRVRKENQNSFTYMEAFTSLFVIGIISMTISTAWQMLLSLVIDPSYAERIIEYTVMTAEQFGGEMTAEQIEDARASFTPTGQIMGFLKSILYMTIIGALIALIIKKEAAPFSGNNTPIDAL